MMMMKSFFLLEKDTTRIFLDITHIGHSDCLRLQLPCDTKTPKTQKYKNKKHHKKSSIPPREFLKKT